MKRSVPFAAALLLVLAAVPARSGQNAGATARLYWLTSNTAALSGNNSTAAIPRCLVTLKGLASLRAVDIQLWVNACDFSGLPPAWQFQAGGCAEGNFTAYTGGFTSGTSSIWPNAFTADPALPVWTEAGMHYGTGDCWLLPHGFGMIRLQAVGTAGVARQTSTEYGVFGFQLDLETGCQGDVVDPNGPAPVLLWPVLRDTCHAGCHGIQIAVWDASLARDYVALDPNYSYLTWNGQLSPEGCLMPENAAQACQAPAIPSTWGRLRRLYR